VAYDLLPFHRTVLYFYFSKTERRQIMNKSCLAILSGLAFGGAVIVNAPYVWSQAAPGSSSEKSGSESRAQKPTDPPVSTSQQPGSSSKSEISRGEGTGMQAGKESRSAGKWSKDKVKAVQEALKSKGFDPGEADGVVGRRTGQALREFQKSQNLQVTGRIDDKTASALGVESGGMASSPSSMGKEATGGGRGSTGPSSGGTSGKGSSSGTGGQPSSADQPGARGGTTIDPPSKPTGKE
jgi:peptidoglycan hydrolase-like protein with peptidoglycan-binding domain